MSLKRPFGISARKIVSVIKENAPKKADFYLTDGSPCFDKNRLCLVPYHLSSPHVATTCGTAFDYLARFLIAQKVTDNKNEAVHDLVAGRLYTASSFRWIRRAQERADGLVEYNNLLNTVINFINQVAPFNEDILMVCIFLAKMEREYRAGNRAEVPAFVLTDEDIDIIEDLRNLALTFINVFLPLVSCNSVLIYNPTFGIGSNMVGGADADIYIDGILFDFKTHKENRWVGSEAAQIAGYYFLDAVAKDAKDNRNCLGNLSIKKIALYNARFGEIDYFDIAKYNPEQIETIKKEIRYWYLRYHLDCSSDSDLKKLGIPLKDSEMRWCSESAQDEIEIWSSCPSKSGKARGKAIVDANSKLDQFLQQADTIALMKNFVQLQNKSREEMLKRLAKNKK